MPSTGKGAGAITTRLRRAIETGVYAHGEQLPAERQLAIALGAARSTVRKALNQLEENGVVIRKVGSGTFVNYAEPLQNSVEDITDLISPLQLIEARFSVEPYMTRLAAIHATHRDLNSMEAILERLESSSSDKNSFGHWDSEFHLLLARCSQNPLLVNLYQQINNVRSHAQWAAMKDTILTPEQIDSYNAQHRDLYEALCQRDVNKAVDHINRHLEKARQDLLGASGI
ncbi:FadR/GntR family transcriptional regulator [Pelagibius sp. Alg239-R121]|uniref:FadR/GntR family transcriptional regulator n=1 Tax=Pelagibius sp. Alg239-R121 TaxID=2993448 RepID=UPI0024A64D37|nr:FadR/GntR family transcriptional regulator [Pelagibius sp. Alg239-R121]